MIKRATPIEHKVSSHHRQNGSVYVNSYIRGEGKRKQETHKLNFNRGKKVSPDYKYTLQYADDTLKSGNLNNSNYKDAIKTSIGYAQKQIRSITISR